MAFSRSTYISKRQTERNPITELTLILQGLSGSKKTDVARQIQHHLKGFCDDNTTEESEETLSPAECQALTGKVLGLHVTVVNTPDITENAESNRTVGDKIKDFACGGFVVVMVTGAEDEEGREMEIKQLAEFRQMVFGKVAESISLTVLVYTDAINAPRPRVSQEADSDGKEPIPEVLFAINADKSENDKQVQMLLNHAKVLVKKRRENCTESSSHQTPNATNESPALVNGNEDVHNSTVITSSPCETNETENELEQTIENLQPEDIRKLDMCCEVFEDNTPAPQDDEQQERVGLSPDELDRNTQNISFVTATPLECGDFQC